MVWSCQVLKLEVSVWMSGSGHEAGTQVPVPADKPNTTAFAGAIGVSDNQSPGPESRNRRPGPPSGGQSAVEPPGPIPNPEVKRRSANGSETIGLVRVGRRQVYARLQAIGAGLFF